MIYRFVVTSCIADNGMRESRVSDLIDPEFALVDTGIGERAREARRTIERLLAGGGGRRRGMGRDLRGDVRDSPERQTTRPRSRSRPKKKPVRD